MKHNNLFFMQLVIVLFLGWGALFATQSPLERAKIKDPDIQTFLNLTQWIPGLTRELVETQYAALHHKYNLGNTQNPKQLTAAEEEEYTAVMQTISQKKRMLLSPLKAVSPVTPPKTQKKQEPIMPTIEEAETQLENATSKDELTKLYRQFSLQFHPDKLHGSHELMGRINSKKDARTNQLLSPEERVKNTQEANQQRDDVHSEMKNHIQKEKDRLYKELFVIPQKNLLFLGTTATLIPLLYAYKKGCDRIYKKALLALAKKKIPEKEKQRRIKVLEKWKYWPGVWGTVALGAYCNSLLVAILCLKQEFFRDFLKHLQAKQVFYDTYDEQI